MLILMLNIIIITKSTVCAHDSLQYNPSISRSSSPPTHYTPQQPRTLFSASDSACAIPLNFDAIPYSS